MSGKGDNRRPEGIPGAYERGFDAIDWTARERQAAETGLQYGRICAEPPVPPEDPEAVALLHSVGAHAQAVGVACGVLGVIRIEAADAP